MENNPLGSMAKSIQSTVESVLTPRAASREGDPQHHAADTLPRCDFPIWVRKPVDAEGPHIMLSGVGRRSCRRHESESSTWLNDTPRLLPTSSKHQPLPSRCTPMPARPPRLLLTRRVSQKRADVRDRKPPREGPTRGPAPVGPHVSGELPTDVLCFGRWRLGPQGDAAGCAGPRPPPRCRRVALMHVRHVCDGRPARLALRMTQRVTFSGETRSRGHNLQW
jgi:hypothetical protein